MNSPILDRKATLNSGKHYCEYTDKSGQCWRLVDPQYKYCFGHNRLVQTEKELKEVTK